MLVAGVLPRADSLYQRKKHQEFCKEGDGITYEGLSVFSVSIGIGKYKIKFE